MLTWKPRRFTTYPRQFTTCSTMISPLLARSLNRSAYSPTTRPELRAKKVAAASCQTEAFQSSLDLGWVVSSQLENLKLICCFL